MAYVQKNNPFPKTACGRRRTFMQSPLQKADPPSGRKSYTLSKEQQDKVFPGLKSSNEPRKTIGPGKNFNKVAKDKSATGGAAGGGMTQKGVDAYKRKNPGSKLQTAVTTKPSKLKPGSKDAKRRKSFCARSKGWTGERGRAARRRWNC